MNSDNTLPHVHNLFLAAVPISYFEQCQSLTSQVFIFIAAESVTVSNASYKKWKWNADAKKFRRPLFINKQTMIAFVGLEGQVDEHSSLIF